MTASGIGSYGRAEEVVGSLAAAFHKDGKKDHTMQPHHLSGLQWAFDGLSLGTSSETFRMPHDLAEALDKLNLPFRIRPGFLKLNMRDDDPASGLSLTVSALQSEVSFQSDDIVTASTGQRVQERRKMAWRGEPYVPGFAYSGKVMPTQPFSPLVDRVRDILQRHTGIWYDCCLLNLYPDGGSGMRYHVDPDQGLLWDYETAVVSVGATRRFAFRPMEGIMSPHNFVVMDGDVTEMFADCQTRFQHTVKTAESRNELAPRSSLVYKRTLFKGA